MAPPFPMKTTRRRTTQITLALLLLSLLLAAHVQSPHLLPSLLPFGRAGPTLHEQLAIYDPIDSRERIAARMKHACTVTLPDAEARARYAGSGWEGSLSRFVSYYNVDAFLKERWGKVRMQDGLQVLDAGGSVFFAPFVDRVNVTKTKYPGTDLHRTEFEDDSFDAIGGDQLIEHTYFPQLVMLELKRILKPGGIAILTTCAYNPVHRSSTYLDFWRFMTDGLRMLSVPFDGGIKLCGSWGTAKVISNRATNGILTREERTHGDVMFDEEIRKNEVGNPFVVWMIVEK